MTYSRRVKRLRAGWDGVCRIEGEPGELRCRIDDISMLGIGVTFAHPAPSHLAGRRISVAVPAMARLEGVITHAEGVLGGAVRAGVAFKDDRPAERDTSDPASVTGHRSAG
jgi:hypothetical protein